jgi:hypothetical protein
VVVAVGSAAAVNCLAKEVSQQMRALDAACQFHAVGRHPQTGEFVLSPGLLIGG